MKDSLFPKAVAMFQRKRNFEKLSDDMKFTYNYSSSDVTPSMPAIVYHARKNLEARTRIRNNCSVTVISNNSSDCADGWAFLNNVNGNSLPIAVAKGKTIKLIVSNGKELMEIRIEN